MSHSLSAIHVSSPSVSSLVGVMPIVLSDTFSGCEDYIGSIVANLRAVFVLPDSVSGRAPHCEDYIGSTVVILRAQG